jgi:hypothetical protein
MHNLSDDGYFKCHIGIDRGLQPMQPTLAGFHPKPNHGYCPSPFAKLITDQGQPSNLQPLRCMHYIRRAWIYLLQMELYSELIKEWLHILQNRPNGS